MLEGQRAVLGDAALQSALASGHARPFNTDGDARALACVPTPQPERKIVAFIVVDISCFTAMSERLDAEHVREMMKGCFGGFAPIIERYGDAIDSFVSDGRIALFDVPLAIEHNAVYMLRASIDQFAAIHDPNNERGRLRRMPDLRQLVRIATSAGYL